MRRDQSTEQEELHNLRVFAATIVIICIAAGVLLYKDTGNRKQNNIYNHRVFKLGGEL